MLFNFCNIFDHLTSRIQKIAWWPTVSKPDFYVFLQWTTQENSKKFHQQLFIVSYLLKECYFLFPFAFLAFFLVFHQNLCFYHFYLSNFRNRILTNQKPENVIRNSQWNCTSELNEVCSYYFWILKWVNLRCNWINFINVLSFLKQRVADYKCVFRIPSNT